MLEAINSFDIGFISGIVFALILVQITIYFERK